MRNTIATFFLLVSIASAQTLESWTVDTDKAVPKPLVIRRGETRDLRVTFKNYSAVAAIPTNASVQLWYRSADISNGLYYVITGSVHSASAGVARVVWTAANCGTATNYTWDLVVLSNTTPYNLRAFGTIQLQAGVYSQATTQTNPATYLALDWARIVNVNTSSAPFMIGDTNLYMAKAEYDAGGARQVAYSNDARIVNALTNAAAFATAAQGAKADTALQPADTNGWVVSSHSAFLTAETDTLQTVLGRGNNAAGQSATNFADISATRRMTIGTGLALGDIDATAVGSIQRGLDAGAQSIGNGAYGASQIGYNSAGASQTIGSASHGASQVGLNDAFLTGIRTIGSDSWGAMQRGYNTGKQTIGNSSVGAIQIGYNSADMAIGNSVYGALQLGHLSNIGGSATNNGDGAVQLFYLLGGQHALTTEDGDASILLGAGVSSNKNAIVAGDGQESHGSGSITAGGGFYGNGSSLTGITAAQVGAVPTNDARYLAALTNGQKIAASTNADYATTSGTASNLVGAQSNTLAMAVTTNLTEYLGAQYELTNLVINTTNLTIAPSFSMTNTYHYRFANTGAVTVAPTGWPVDRYAEMVISLSCASNVNFILPTNAPRFANGTWTYAAPSIRTNALLFFVHSPHEYWYMAGTNDAPIGTP